MIVQSVEEVVLVDEENNVLGTTAKASIHSASTPLHRGFSLFLFDRQGRLLLQKRSNTKTTWPNAWSNSVCGHPALNETNVDAAKRRLAYELGMSALYLEEIVQYRYTFVRDGVMENEICPILVGFTDNEPRLNTAEVAATRWVGWKEFLKEIETQKGLYSEWCEEEARILAAHPRCNEIFAGREKYFEG